MNREDCGGAGALDTGSRQGGYAAGHLYLLDTSPFCSWPFSLSYSSQEPYHCPSPPFLTVTIATSLLDTAQPFCVHDFIACMSLCISRLSLATLRYPHIRAAASDLGQHQDF